MADQRFTFENYLAALSPERRSEVERTWRVVRENIPDGYSEQIEAKFLTFKAGDELFVALASQKNYISLYLMPIYIFPELKAAFDAAIAGNKLKCGKSCVNFLQADELPLQTIAEILAASPNPEAYKTRLQQVRAAGKQKKSHS